jgi:tetratricopeptide (TPR) repeat protein
MSGRPRIALLPLLLLAAACASIGREIDRLPPDAPGFRLLPRPAPLPKGKQTSNCGPEAFWAVLHFHGKRVSLEEVEREIYVASISGSITPKVAALARKHGMSADFSGGGGLRKLREAIDEQIPPVIEVTRSGMHHYFLVAGYSDEKGVVVCEHYEGRQFEITYEKLDEIWRPRQYQMIVLKPSNASKRTETGYDFLAAGNNQRAEEQFDLALAENPDLGRALAGKGRCRLEAGDLDGALKYFELAHAAIPEDPEVLNNLAHTLLQKKADPERAERLAVDAVARKKRQISDFEEELKLAPSGTALRIQADIDEAKSEIFYYFGTLGQAHAARGKLQACVPVLEESLRFPPAEDPDALGRRRLELGDALQTLGEPARAQEHFRKGLEAARDPELRKRLEKRLAEGSEADGRR